MATLLSINNLTMITDTSIIILNYTRYSDSSIIVNALSEHFGRISFMVYGINSKNRSKLTAFQPLFLLNAQLYYKPNRGLQKLKEYKINPPLYNLTSDIRKSTLAIFIAELLLKTIKEEYADKNLFDFIKTSIQLLEMLENNHAIFPLVFLLKLSRFLGFAPEPDSSNSKYYDYKNGVAVNSKPHHHYYLKQTDFNTCIVLINTNFNNLGRIKINKEQRNTILNILLNLYEIHILNFQSLKSYPVLKEVFS